MKAKRVIFVALVAAAAFGCHREDRYESAVQIMRKEEIEKDDGGVTALDFETEWDACPGDQFQVIRGGKEFAECAAKYEKGDYVPVIVKHFWDARSGVYRWDIERLGDCARPIDPGAYGSYEKSAECKDIVGYGRTIGFECNRRPFRALVKRCPWMARE